MNKDIKNWELITGKIVNTFFRDYFDDNNPEYFWVSDDIGSILNYGDYWFSFSDILTCYKLNITEEQLINWYDFCLSNQKVNISLAKFILSPQERKEQQKKQLKELEDRVKFAEEEFKKALEEFNK